MQQHKHEYDRFLLLRFDIMYKLRIFDWPKWNEKGIILVNRDVHYPSSKLYADMTFIVDNDHVDTFSSAFHNEHDPVCLHHIGRELERHAIPFHLMYKEYYAGNEHALHVWYPIDPIPNLDKYTHGVEIKDLSRWNPGWKWIV